MIDATPFDISRQPKIGLTVLEASAGTGKTFSIAGMTVLALARGTVTTRDICVVTFTEMATSELSGRLRSRLVTAIELLQKADVSEREELNDVDRALLDVGGGGESERSERISRLASALTEFDAMTI
ncbi:MAG: exodeoxyribonuclease V, partial [Actinobacteria bacterium]|nr:exodeoxyribonuclease V [Actinomycetota bacterium]